MISMERAREWAESEGYTIFSGITDFSVNLRRCLIDKLGGDLDERLGVQYWGGRGEYSVWSVPGEWKLDIDSDEAVAGYFQPGEVVLMHMHSGVREVDGVVVGAADEARRVWEILCQARLGYLHEGCLWLCPPRPGVVDDDRERRLARDFELERVGGTGWSTVWRLPGGSTLYIARERTPSWYRLEGLPVQGATNTELTTRLTRARRDVELTDTIARTLLSA